MSASTPSIHVAWFDRALDRSGPAYGTPETLSWDDFTTIFRHRRIGEKDGTCFVPARFKSEPGRRHVRRLKANVIARTGIALDVELNKKTGEIPPNPMAALRRVKSQGWCCIIYSSHSHQPAGNIRYRLVLPISAEIAPEFSAPLIVAVRLGLDGVLDHSKITPASVFYCPSQDSVYSDHHFAQRLQGGAVEAAWLVQEGQALLAAAEAQAQAETAARLATKAARGVTAEDSLIERIKEHLDLEQILLSHGYDKQGSKKGARFKNPESSSGIAGGKIFGNGERFFTHNASDPLHEDNLPDWCDVRAVDAFDATVILDFNGDHKKALRDLAGRFGLNKNSEKKKLAAMMFSLIKRQVSQIEFDSAVFEDGKRLGLSREEVCQTAKWVIDQATQGAA